MRLQILSVLAAGLLLAACSSDEPVETASTQGAGSTTQTGAATGNGAVTPGSVEDFNQNVGNTVYFGFDRYDLTAEAQSQLQKEAALVPEDLQPTPPGRGT